VYHRAPSANPVVNTSPPDTALPPSEIPAAYPEESICLADVGSLGLPVRRACIVGLPRPRRARGVEGET
jgi:hypothetical protein